MMRNKMMSGATALSGGVLLGLLVPATVLAQNQAEPPAGPASVTPEQAQQGTVAQGQERRAETQTQEQTTQGQTTRGQTTRGQTTQGQTTEDQAEPTGVTPEATTTVTIQGQRPRNRIDRQTYDMKQEIDVQSGTAADALNKVPSVNVDPEGNVTLRGNSSVQIYVDGKPSAMMRGDNRAATLQSMTGADIDSVEVMNNPGAQFSAEGSGGIINIVMRRNRKPGNSGTLIANAGSQGRYNATFSGARNTGDLTLSGGASYRHDGRDGRSSAIQQRFNSAGDLVSERAQGGENSNRFDNLSLNGAIDYNISEADSVSSQFGYGKRTFENEGETVFTGFDNSRPGDPRLLDYIRRSQGEGAREDLSASIRWDHKGDQPAETLKVDLRLSSSRGDNSSTNTTDNTDPLEPDFFDTKFSKSRSFETDFSVDYARNVGDAQLSLGLDLDYEDDSFVNRSTTTDPDAVNNALLNNDFASKQIIGSAYVTWQMPIGEKWTVMGGLRSETIDLTSRQITTGSIGETSYTKLVPSAFATYVLSDDAKLRFSYSHRLRRPNPQDLNPYVIYIDPQNVVSGNPDLKPSETDSFEVGYEYSREQTSYEIRAYYRTTTNQVTDVSTFISPGVLLTTKQNLGEGRSGGLEFNYNNRFWNKLGVRVNGNVGYEELETPNRGTQSGVTLRGRASLDYQLTRKDRIQLSYFTSGRQLSGQGYREPFSRGNLSYRHQFNPKIALTATVDDVFRTGKFRNVVDTPTIYSVSARSQSAPTFYIGLTYILGGASGNQQDQQRGERWRDGGGRGNWGGPGGGF